MEYADIIHRCFRCGYCKFTSEYEDFNCPTYRKFWFETYSPGGRMWLLRAWRNGEIGPSERLAEIFYSCVTCGNCVEHCAFDFRENLVNIFVEARKEMVEQGLAPPAVRDYLKGIHVHGNPYKEASEDRGAWAEGLDIEPYSGQEYLLYVGCVGSYDERGKQIARSLATLLTKAGVSVGILGARETCDGNEVRVLGEQELFALLAENNIRLFNGLGVKKIVTLSPHGYNAFKNHYPALDGNVEVLHYTQLLARLVQSGALAFSELKTRVSYHDPCYLGRHNGEFDAPRSVLRRIPGLSLQEMAKIKKNALCCGGGGGNFFTDIIGSGANSPARIRIKEAAETGAEVLAVACPMCAKMLGDAAKDEGLQDRIEVKDIAEIACAAGVRASG
jgi:Fe-S oxidoreductase